MRVSRSFKLFFVSVLLLSASVSVLAGGSLAEAAKLLPDKVGTATAQGKAAEPRPAIFIQQIKAEDFGVTSSASRPYVAANGEKFWVRIVQTRSDAHAYALLTELRRTTSEIKTVGLTNPGTTAFTSASRLDFHKGPVVVTIAAAPTSPEAALLDFARSLAATLDQGTGEIPPLVGHLPEQETAQARAVYAVSLRGLQDEVRDQPVLDAVSFAGGTEAVTAKYDQGQLVIVEFQTPQFATETDARVGQRIAELRAQGQRVPTAYRRVGNYVVFVFDAPNEQAAAQLIGQVQYDKVVQWLGEDPHRIERANRYWINMSGSLILNTVKATGLAILLCLGIGGLVGGVVFMRRRARVALNEQYTDAGGMMRLNLDELPHQKQPSVCCRL